jgi:hypothetical protein
MAGGAFDQPSPWGKCHLTPCRDTHAVGQRRAAALDRDPAPGDYPPERQRPARSRVNGSAVPNSTASAAPRRHVAPLAKSSARVASAGHRGGNDGSAGSPAGLRLTGLTDGAQGSRPRNASRRGETAAREASADSRYDSRASSPSSRHARSGLCPPEADSLRSECLRKLSVMARAR